MKNITCTVFAFLFVVNASFACSCFGPQNFCDFVFNNFSEPSVVVKATKIRDVDHGMDIEVTQVLLGQVDEEVVRVWGDVGHLCRYYTRGFGIGEEYLFALSRINRRDTFYRGEWLDKEEIGDFVISVCGKSFWHCDDQSNGGETAAEIEACFGESIEFCGPVPIDINFCDIQRSEVFPNPSSHLCFVKFEDKPAFSQGTVKIFDQCGKQVFFTDDIGSVYHPGQLTLDVSDFEEGIYFIDLEVPEVCATGKLTRRIMVRE